MKLQLDAARIVDVVLAPSVRMDFRGLNVEQLKPGTAVSIEGVPHRTIKDEVRATTLTIGQRTFELR